MLSLKLFTAKLHIYIYIYIYRHLNFVILTTILFLFKGKGLLYIWLSDMIDVWIRLILISRQLIRLLFGYILFRTEN